MSNYPDYVTINGDLFVNPNLVAYVGIENIGTATIEKYAVYIKFVGLRMVKTVSTWDNEDAAAYNAKCLANLIWKGAFE